MSTIRPSDHFGDNPGDQEDSVDFEFFEEHRESIPGSLKKNDNNNSNLVKANNKTFVVEEKQEGDLYKQNKELESSDETYHSTEEEEKNKKGKEDGNNWVKSPTFHKSVNNSDKSNKNKAVVKNIDSDSVNDDDEEEQSISSGDIYNIPRNKNRNVTSRNSPIRQSPNKNNERKKQTRPSFRIASNSDIFNMNNECINVAQIADALKSFDKKIHRLHIRPPWKDPNSRPLPSDRTTAFYNMYEDYLKYRNQRPLSSLGYSTTQCLNDEIAVRRLYHSTLNRLRQNEKIQLENYELAKRLQKVRPTTGMTKEEQLRDYKKYFITPNSLYPYYKSEFISYRKNSHINQNLIKNKKQINTLKPNEFTSKSVNNNSLYNKYQTSNNNDKNNLKRSNKDVQGKIKLENSYNSEFKHESHDSHSSTLNHQVKYSKQFNKSITVKQQSSNNRPSSSSTSSSSFNSSPELSVK
ncbi:unnamed protein product [Schistosoma mattheei]|uniref:Uncharacterized protein n=1 Tax=Schistosoma mattheei TaxID=31246 RepID=A0A183PJF9_9TREM|nr:unnamed protein product [Schistosoma mattheei]